jgi:hypothetical protein
LTSAAQPVDRPVSVGAKSMRASILSPFNAAPTRSLNAYTAIFGPFLAP